MITSSGRASRDTQRPPSPGPDPVGELARTRFGIGYLYPIQRFVISNILERAPQIVVLPTGAGKSLCFQLPALLVPGLTLVLMPLRSLLSDQLRKMRQAGVVVGALHGGLPPAEKEALFRGIRAGDIRLVLATPEACLAEPNLSALRRCRVSHLVVDEAHCVTEWGDTFRPTYLEVGRLGQSLSVSMVSAFTATASPRVIGRIRDLLFGDADVRIVTDSVDRPNISYAVQPVLSRAHALALLARAADRPLLVFCRTRNDTETAARAALRVRPDRPAFFYHAGLSVEERAEVETWFLGSRDGALYATCAYGMGVDKPDIRTVVHADIPASVEAYLQESGRAGRDGKPSRAILLVGNGEEAFLSRLADPVARQRFNNMLEYAAGGNGCRRNALLSLIGQEPVACSGCDLCHGIASHEPAGQREIHRFLQRHPRRFSISQAAEILCGWTSPRARRAFYDSMAGAGSLPGWEKDDVESAIRAMLARGYLSVPAGGFWKDRLSAKPARPEARFRAP